MDMDLSTPEASMVGVLLPVLPAGDVELFRLWLFMVFQIRQLTSGRSFTQDLNLLCITVLQCPPCVWWCSGGLFKLLNRKIISPNKCDALSSWLIKQGSLLPFMLWLISTC